MRVGQRGVTLIELLVVIVVIGILASVAWPSYRQQVIRTNRADAKAALEQGRQTLERCFTRFNAYNDGGCEVDFDPAVVLPSGTYQLTAVLAADTFVITATPLGGQLDDTRCGRFTIDELGRHGVIPTGTTIVYADLANECWGR